MDKSPVDLGFRSVCDGASTVTGQVTLVSFVWPNQVVSKNRNAKLPYTAYLDDVTPGEKEGESVRGRLTQDTHTHRPRVRDIWYIWQRFSLFDRRRIVPASKPKGRLYTFYHCYYLLPFHFCLCIEHFMQFLFGSVFFFFRWSELIWQKTTERFVWTWIYKLYCWILCFDDFAVIFQMWPDLWRSVEQRRHKPQWYVIQQQHQQKTLATRDRVVCFVATWNSYTHSVCTHNFSTVLGIGTTYLLHFCFVFLCELGKIVQKNIIIIIKIEQNIRLWYCKWQSDRDLLRGRTHFSL